MTVTIDPTVAHRIGIWSDPQNDDSWPHVPSRFGETVFVE